MGTLGKASQGFYQMLGKWELSSGDDKLPTCQKGSTPLPYYVFLFPLWIHK